MNTLYYRNNGASVEYEYTETNRKPDALPNARINLYYVNYKGSYVDEAFRFWAQEYNRGWKSVTHAGTVQGLYHDAYARYKSNPGQYQENTFAWQSAVLGFRRLIPSGSVEIGSRNA